MVPSQLNVNEYSDMDEAKLRFQSIFQLMGAIYMNDIHQLLTFFDGHCMELSSQIKACVLTLCQMFGRQPESHIVDHPISLLEIIDGLLVDSNKGSKSPNIQLTDTFTAVRLHHVLEEAFTYYQLDNLDVLPALGNLNVAAASYCINQKRIDASDITCPVTPLLFPLLQTVDALYQSACSKKFSTSLTQVVSCRDRLWRFLKRSNNIGIGSNSQLGISFGGFLINYMWLKKALGNFSNCISDSGINSDKDILQTLRQLHLSLERIDRMIEEYMGGSISSSDILWKHGGHPILPSTGDNFKILSSIQDIARQCTLTNEDWFGFTRTVSSTTYQIDANKLVKENHRCLYLDKSFVSQLLGAMSTIFWATTDEIKDHLLSTNNTCEFVTTSILQSFEHQKSSFVADLTYSTIDTAIRTVENTLDLDAIKSLGGQSASRRDGTNFVHNLVTRLGEVQTSQIGEQYLLLHSLTLCVC
jgi:hypothetical protein